MKNTIVLVSGIFIGADGSLGYKNNHEHALRVWIGPSVIRHDVGKLHIFIQRVDDNLGSTECEYASIEAFKNNWKDIRLSENSGLDFGIALVALRIGKKVTRPGWNGGGMWAAFGEGKVLPPEGFWNEHTKKFAQDNGGEAVVGDYINFKTAQNTIEMGWRPTTIDMLAHDWQVIE